MTECWALFDKSANLWHCDLAGNVAWWPNQFAADAQIESFKNRAARLNGGNDSGWFDNLEPRIFYSERILEQQVPTKKPAAEEESGRALAQEGL